MLYKGLIPNAPYIKGKGYCVNPVVKYGIPACADSRRNKKVIGTAEYESYWEEQLYYCKNGYQTGGLWVPGRFYYYMNFNNMSTINGVITPDMVDLHLELAYLIEYAKANGKNIISAKGRRKGISEFTHKAVIDYGWRFNFPSSNALAGAYQGAVAAGQDIYAQDFMTKWRAGDALMVPEFRMKKLLNNDDEVIGGYEIQNEESDWNEEGSKAKIYVRTAFKTGNIFKGLYLNDAIAEEGGEFDKLKEFYSATKDCLMDGDKQIGTFFFYGTGGKINKESKDFKEIYYNQDAFNFIEFTILAPRFYKPNYGGATRGGQDISEIPNLLKTHKPYELIGVEDIQEAERAIKEKRAEFLKKGQLKEYNEDRQNNPLTKEDIFLSTAVNEFDVNKLNDQLFAIDNNPPKHIRCKIDWETDSKGEIKQPLATKLVPLPPEDDRKDYVLVHVDYFAPIKTYSHLYCAGIDSYDQDTSRTSKSLGAMCVLIRRNNIPGALELAPIATIRCRPERKEKFYELCLKLSVHYNLIESVLVDVRCPLVIEYFKQRGCERYLAYRPTKFEKENSEQTNTYGVSLNLNSRPQMVSIMQSAIFDFSCNIWFRPLIKELLNFDDVAIGSDNDLADAYGIALMQDVANTIAPQDNKDFSYKEMYELGGEFKVNENGEIIPSEPTPFKGEEHDHPNLWGTPL